MARAKFNVTFFDIRTAELRREMVIDRSVAVVEQAMGLSVNDLDYDMHKLSLKQLKQLNVHPVNGTCAFLERAQ